MSSIMTRLTVPESDYGQRLDVFVTKNLKGRSRAFVQKLDDQDKIHVNGKSRLSSYKLKPGDEITIEYDQDQAEQIPAIDLPILYEDEDCIVINKPSGVLTHSKGVFNPEATIATFIAQRGSELTGERGGIVHRLDRATSGVIIGAKKAVALSWLQKQFSTRKVKKSYVAVIGGALSPPKAIIDMPIERNPQRPQTFRVNANGKPALTAYETLKTTNRSSLIKLLPETGRTHQLRVHLKHLGHPIIGDTLYGGQPAERLYLHATSLEITLPNKERHVFVANIPTEFDLYLDQRT